jgi:hypothetical protein
MKAILKFNLPEETLGHLQAINGNKYWGVLWDMDQYLRNILHYNVDEYAKKNPIEIIEEIRSFLNEDMQKENLSFDII